MTHDDFATWDAAYVLGSLAPAERRAFEEHLRDCDRCSAAVTELAGLPGLLARVPRAQAFELLEPGGPSIEPSPALLTDLLRAARRRRVRRRWWTAGIATAAAVVVGAAAFVLPSVLAPALAPHPAPAASAVMQEVRPSALSADVRLIAEPWGTRIESRCHYAAAPGETDEGRSWTYVLVVTDRAGKQTPVSTWTATEGSTVVPTATTSVPVSDIAAVDIRSDDGVVLLRSTFR